MLLAMSVPAFEKNSVAFGLEAIGVVVVLRCLHHSQVTDSFNCYALGAGSFLLTSNADNE